MNLNGRDVRVGIVGAGMIGRVHLRAARLNRADVVGVAASSPDRSREAAELLGVDRAFDSADELVVDDSIDVVHICAPNRFHAPLALAALDAGKDVICEKPLALDRGEAAEIAQAAAATDRILAVPFIYRYYPAVREARARVRSGSVGSVQLIIGTYLQDWLADPATTNWRARVEDGGASRAFADIGSHLCDLIEFVTGSRLIELTARTRITAPERGSPVAPEAVETEDVALVQFQTDSGAIGSLGVSQISLGAKNRLTFRIDGTDGSLFFDQERPDTLEVGRADGVVELLPREERLLSAEAKPYVVLPQGHPQGYHDSFDLFVSEAYEAVRSRVVPEGLPTVADGVRSVDIVECVLESQRQGRSVEVPEFKSHSDLQQLPS